MSFRALTPIVVVLSLVTAAAAWATTGGDTSVSRPGHDGASTPDIAVALGYREQVYNYVTARWLADQAAWYAAANYRPPAPAARHASAPCSAPRDTGGPPPPGFPGYIVQRESGGDPNAVNPSSGAYGRAQLLSSHFCGNGGCVGQSYESCWATLWANGAGASNWSTR